MKIMFYWFKTNLLNGQLSQTWCFMKTEFYDRIMLKDECKAITGKYEQNIVVENVTFNRKAEHNFSVSQYSNT